MSQAAAPKISPWVKSPTVDLFFFGFGWLLILGAYFFIDRSDFAATGRTWILNAVLLIAVFHRHLTFPLVYGDKAQLQARPKSYLWLPVLFGGVTVLAYFIMVPAQLQSEAISYPVKVTSPQTLKVRFWQDGAVKHVPVTFDRDIADSTQLREKFTSALNGRVGVESEGDRMNFRLLTQPQDKPFSILRGDASPAFFQSLGFGSGALKSGRSSRPLLMALVVLSVLWNFYHTLMQKMGILRVYSRKAEYGKSWLDKAMVWSWFAYLFFQIGAMPSMVKRVSGLTTAGKYLVQTLDPFLKVFPALAWISLAVAMAITILYLKEEWTHRERFHWPKNIFLISILMLYSLFFYDFFIAYVAFGFSHAIEYLAFVNIYGRKKYLGQPAASSAMARWVRHQGVSMVVFIVAMMAIFIPWHYLQQETLTAYILATSFLHFLYDGWIWKVRNPAVGKPLGIDYAPPASPASPKLQTA